MAITQNEYIDAANKLASLAADQGDALDNYIDEIVSILKPIVAKYDNSWKYFNDTYGKDLLNIETTSFYDKIRDAELDEYYDAWNNEQKAVQLLQDAGVEVESIIDVFRSIIDKYS